MAIAQHVIDEALAAPHGTMEAIARKYEVPYNTLRRLVSEQRRSASGVYTPFPEPAQLVNVPPLQVDTDTFVYCADLHCPSYSKQTLRRMVTVADALQMDTLIIGGDLFDFSTISRHGRAEMQASVDTTIEVAGLVLDTLLDYFARIYILPGNHDDRMIKKLDDIFSFDKLVRAGVKRGQVSNDVSSDAPIITTDNSYLYVGQEEIGWVCGHPMRYSRTPVQLSKVAMRERRNVLAAHTHLQSMLYSDDGRYLVIEPGHCLDVANTPYQMRTRGINTYAESTAGFVVVRENRPQLFSDALTDWRDYGL